MKVMFAGPSGIGKAQPLDEPVLTTRGWKNMGDLSLEDQLVDPVTGGSMKLTGIYDRGILPVYKVSFSDGTYTRVSGDHLWKVIKKSHKEYKSYVVDTNYLLDNYKKLSKSGNNVYRYMIPSTAPVIMDHKNLPIHPYILGFILGDGCISGDKNCVRVSTNIVDALEVIGRLRSFGANISVGNDYPESGTSHFRILDMDILKDMGLTGKLSYNKFIPNVYLESSIEDRKLLLAGLLDTDGSTPSSSIKARTCINFSSTSKDLAYGVLYLLRSLGEVASINFYDRTDEGKSLGYMVHCNISFNPYYRIYRKEILNKNMSSNKRRNHREKRILDITYIGDLPVRCIKVDTDHGLYITRDFTVTHNTTLAEGLSVAKDIVFLSGSVSDFIPETKDMPHKDMLGRDSKDLYMEDYKILNLRKKLFQDKEDFVSDRSFLDSAAYFYYKQSDKIPACEVEHFLELCKMCLNKYCTHLIYLPLDMFQIKEWLTEENGKRITSNYFQVLISGIMSLVLDAWGAEPTKTWSYLGGLFKNTHLQWGAQEYIISSPYGQTKVLEIGELDITIRQELISRFLCK